MADLVDDLTLSQREIDSLRGAPIVRILSYAIAPNGKILPFSPSGDTGGGGDMGSARETTLQEVLSHIQAVNGNTYILAQQAQDEGLHMRPNAIVTIHPTQTLTVGVTISSPDVPDSANAATVHVVSGAVRRSIGGTPSPDTPRLNAGDSETIQGAELYLYRLIRDEGSDALVHIEYRTVR